MIQFLGYIMHCLQYTPWVSLGSEVDVENINLESQRENVTVTIERRRIAFNADYSFSDKDAQEIHSLNSSHMELRPFKDQTYELQYKLLDKHVQVLEPVQEVAVQVSEDFFKIKLNVFLQIL